MPLPEGVKFHVGEVLRLKKALDDAFFEGLQTWRHEVLVDDTFDNVLSRVQHVFKITESSMLPARESLMPYWGREITNQLLDILAWRFAGGAKRLRNGMPLKAEFDKREHPTWVPLWIEDCELDSLREKGLYLLTEMRVCSGEFAGLTFTQSMLYGQMTNHFAKLIGFCKWKNICHRELVQCIMLGLLDLRDPRHIQITEVDATPSVISHNQKLRRERNKPCIRSLKVLCHHCISGYTGMVHCPRACRKEGLVIKACWKCGKDEGFRQSAGEKSVCEACRLKKTWAKLKLRR